MYRVVVEKTDGSMVTSSMVLSQHQAVRVQMHIAQSPRVRAVHLAVEETMLCEDEVEQALDAFITKHTR